MIGVGSHKILILSLSKDEDFPFHWRTDAMGTQPERPPFRRAVVDAPRGRRSQPR